MSDHDLLIDATAKIMILDNPTDRIQLPPPPPAAEDESAIMWHPTDRPEEPDRIPIANVSEDDRAAAAVMAIWLGGQAIYASLPDPVREEDPPLPPKKDKDEPDA